MEKKVRAYTRVSTTMQKEEGISLDTQLTRIKEYCTYKKLDEPILYTDEGLSAKNMERPALQRLLNDIQEGDIIICLDLSRLSRNTSDAINILNIIKNKKSKLIILNPDIDFSSAVGEMMFTIISSFAQYERKLTSERVSANMLNLSKQNLLRPKPPFGWKFIGKDKDMIKDEKEQDIIKKIKELYNDGWNYSNITNVLNTDYPDIQKFYAQTIKNILSDCGYIKTKRKIIENKFLKSRKKNLNIENNNLNV